MGVGKWSIRLSDGLGQVMHFRNDASKWSGCGEVMDSLTYIKENFPGKQIIH